jgi:NAD/NADP transhydrogenase alpha subunit
LTIGIPKESFPNEMRVAQTPESVRALVKLGFKVIVESGAGQGAKFQDNLYKDAGAEVKSANDALTADIVLKVFFFFIFVNMFFVFLIIV